MTDNSIKFDKEKETHSEFLERWEKTYKPPTSFVKDQEKYLKTMKDKVIIKASKDFDLNNEIDKLIAADEESNPYWSNNKGLYWDREEKCCDAPDKYKNIVSNNLKFWSCKNCGADLGDIN